MRFEQVNDAPTVIFNQQVCKVLKINLKSKLLFVVSERNWTQWVNFSDCTDQKHTQNVFPLPPESERPLMKVIFYPQVETLNDNRIHARRTKVCRTLVIEDDGTEDGGRMIAKFWKHEDAVAVAEAMGWHVSDEMEEGK